MKLRTANTRHKAKALRAARRHPAAMMEAGMKDIIRRAGAPYSARRLAKAVSVAMERAS